MFTSTLYFIFKDKIGDVIYKFTKYYFIPVLHYKIFWNFCDLFINNVSEEFRFVKAQINFLKKQTCCLLSNYLIYYFIWGLLLFYVFTNGVMESDLCI